MNGFEVKDPISSIFHKNGNRRRKNNDYGHAGSQVHSKQDQ